MTTKKSWLFTILGLAWLWPSTAQAGMGTFTLTDLGRLRIQGISFFLAIFLLSAWLIQRLWNYLRNDFAFLPRLSYPRAVGVVTLWGLLFVLVMTMISGARELMTPGAWVKEGRTYRLADETPAQQPAEDEHHLQERRQKLEALREALWLYAMTHEHKFPDETMWPEIPQDKWQMPDLSGSRYLYVPKQMLGKDAKPLAYEPEIYPGPRWMLMTNGDLHSLSNQEIDKLFAAEKH